jgi:predicted nuclease of predicted toxin-antitoxin system
VLIQSFDDCQHVDGIGLPVPAKDTEIWKYAKQNNYVIITNNDDFLNLSSIYGFPPKVVLLRTGNQSRKYTERLLIDIKPRMVTFAESLEYGVLEII